MNNEVLTLISKKKKGFLRLIFSRIGLILLLIILQLGILLSLYHWFTEYFRWFAMAQWIFSVGMILYLFNCVMDSSGKLTWLNLIMLFPIPATILLWFTREDIGHRWIKARMTDLIRDTHNIIPQDPETIKKPAIQDSGTDDLSHFLCRTGTYPVYEHTKVDYYPLGENAFEVMIEELKKAEHFIFLEYFIVDEGYMWGSILKILADKAAQGVDVRMMYDGMCEVSLLPHDYSKRLQQLGIKCKPFIPIAPFISTQYNYRDHRKILVIDGKVAFNGGINLADEYINKIDRFGHWKDTAIRLRGEAVKSFTLMFLQMWNLDEKEPDWKEATISYPQDNDGFVIPYGDAPLDNDKVGERVYADILNRAKNYVYIMTPYLILDNELENALRYAAQRGIDVKLILPGIPDKKAAYALAKSHYRSLTEAGVKIYEYTPGFVHAKVFVSDDEKAVVGTINLDYRSLYHHFECATYMFRTSCISEIKKDFEDTLTKCARVTDETIRGEKLYYKLLGTFMKIIAPLM